MFGVLLSAGQAADALFQLVDVLAGLGADGDLIGLTGQRCVQQVGLVVDHQVRDVPCLELLCQLPVVRLHPQGAVYYQDGHIGLVQHLEGTLDTQLSQSAYIVNTRGINDDHGADGQQLHGLLHRVGGGALHLGDQGEGLTGDGIDHAGLPSVAQTEEADVYPFARGAVIQSHRDTSFLRTGNRGGWTP